MNFKPTKKVTGCIISAVIAVSMLSAVNVSAALSGDANGDGKFNVRDAAYIARMMAKGQTGKPYSAADYNRDGKVNVRDAAAIAKKIAAKTGTAMPKTSSSFANFAGEYGYGGYGGHFTTLKLKSDGSFTGEFKNYDLGTQTVYMNDFKGKLTGLKKVNDYTYKATMPELKYTYKPGTSKKIDGITYEYTSVAVIEGAKNVYLYKKGAPTDKLPTYFDGDVFSGMNIPAKLPFNGIYIENKCGLKGN